MSNVTNEIESEDMLGVRQKIDLSNILLLESKLDITPVLSDDLETVMGEIFARVTAKTEEFIRRARKSSSYAAAAKSALLTSSSNRKSTKDILKALTLNAKILDYHFSAVARHIAVEQRCHKMLEIVKIDDEQNNPSCEAAFKNFISELKAGGVTSFQIGRIPKHRKAAIVGLLAVLGKGEYDKIDDLTAMLKKDSRKLTKIEIEGDLDLLKEVLNEQESENAVSPDIISEAKSSPVHATYADLSEPQEMEPKAATSSNHFDLNAELDAGDRTRKYGLEWKYDRNDDASNIMPSDFWRDYPIHSSLPYRWKRRMQHAGEERALSVKSPRFSSYSDLYAADKIFRAVFDEIPVEQPELRIRKYCAEIMAAEDVEQNWIKLWVALPWGLKQDWTEVKSKFGERFLDGTIMRIQSVGSNVVQELIRTDS